MTFFRPFGYEDDKRRSCEIPRLDEDKQICLDSPKTRAVTASMFLDSLLEILGIHTFQHTTIESKFEILFKELLKLRETLLGSQIAEPKKPERPKEPPVRPRRRERW